jgi:hypothetical protein
VAQVRDRAHLLLRDGDLSNLVPAVDQLGSALGNGTCIRFFLWFNARLSSIPPTPIPRNGVTAVMKYLLSLVLLLAVPALAHHSFAVYDFDTQITFEGTVEKLQFRNPHIALTLKTTDANGNEQIVNFIEGAPANMLARAGLKPDMIKKGTRITAIGSPLHDDKTKFFLREIRLQDGQAFK